MRASREWSTTQPLGNHKGSARSADGFKLLAGAMDTQKHLRRLAEAIEAQKEFCRRVPDPDTRERADGHLIEMVHRYEGLTLKADLERPRLSGS